MKVFKFGGASVKDASAVENLYRIVSRYQEPLVIVVSAMGKMTNAFERLVDAYFNHKPNLNSAFLEIVEYHLIIVKQLFLRDHKIFSELDNLFQSVSAKLETDVSMNFNFEYDQLVPFGELISTTIVAEYLALKNISAIWIDIRKVLKTDDNYREANVLQENSGFLAKKVFMPENNVKYITQGFIGSTETNLPTTLGREGSDYTAALIASFIGGESVTVWKDVPGVLNADPKWFDDTVKIDKLTYTDAIELAFYGASVLHPKTIQPVKQNNIPLHVKSFFNPDAEGTIIGDFKYDKLVPSFIFKVDQVLINIHPRDLSFIAEHNLEKIFSILARYSLKVNLMQNTAVSFRICVNNDETRIPKITEELSLNYKITFENDLELITIRYYDKATIDRVLVKKEVLLEQHTKNTVQMVVRKLN